MFARLPATTSVDVRGMCDCSAMNESRQLSGIELRYVLTMHLSQHGPATVTELIDAIGWHGFSVRGRASKAVSDALRWEIGRGRVHRLGRGRYGPAYIPRSTEHRMLQRVLALRAEARLSRGGGQRGVPPGQGLVWQM